MKSRIKSPHCQNQQSGQMNKGGKTTHIVGKTKLEGGKTTHCGGNEHTVRNIMSFFKANINTNQNKEQLLDYILCEFKFIH